jgi:aminotransferase
MSTDTTTATSPLLAALAQNIRNIRAGDESAFIRLLAMAEGREHIIRLGRGEPDIPVPAHIAAAAKKAIDDGHTTYTPPAGLPDLRMALARKFREDNGLDYDPDREIIVTAGAQESMVVTLQTLVDPGDEVIIAEPYYMAYEANIHMAGGVPVKVPTYEETGFELLPEAVSAAITDRTKLVVLVSPNNPTAGVLTRETLDGLAEVIRGNNLVAISDELYEKVVYDGFKPVSFATLPGMRERTVTINGFSKAYSMTGFRVGYMAGPADYIRAALEPRHSLSICATTPSQYAALAALEGPQDFLAEMMEEYTLRRALMMDAFDALGITYGPPLGGFYLFANIKASGMSSFDLCAKALNDYGVLFFPGNMFGEGQGEGYIRISYLADRSDLAEALDRIGHLWRSVTGSA